MLASRHVNLKMINPFYRNNTTGKQACLTLSIVAALFWAAGFITNPSIYKTVNLLTAIVGLWTIHLWRIVEVLTEDLCPKWTETLLYSTILSGKFMFYVQFFFIS